MQAIFWSGAVLLGLYWLLGTLAYGWRSSVLYLWLMAALYCALCAPFADRVPLLWLPPLLALCCYGAFLLRCALFRPQGARSPEVILILGVRQDGTQPRALFRERVVEGVKWARRYPDAVILLAGGKVFGQRETEAAAMARELIQRGIPAERLLLEKESRTTHENFFNNLSHLSGKRVLVVTSRYHAYRAACLARRLLPQGELSLACPRGGGLFLPHLYLRELCTFTVDLLRGRLRLL